MNINYINQKIFVACLILLFSAGCTTTVPLRTWVPPHAVAQNIAARVDYLIIVNSHKGELVYDIFEDALRERFSALPFLKVEASSNTAEVALQLKNYNFIPALQSKGRVAFLSYEINEINDVQRLQASRVVNLRRCNNLIKSKNRKRCRITGRAIIKQGVQNLRYSQKVIFNLTNQEGHKLIAVQQIKRGYQKKGKLIPDEILLRKKVSDLIAREYSKLVLPFRKNIEVEMLSGDSIAVEMIEKGAYRQAFKRLEKLLAQQERSDKSAENIYLQGLALEFQSELSGALSYYREALLIDPENETIVKAVNRIKAATSQKNKSA
ncbi:MAG: hypothetical protein H8E38_07675 [SAR324 cluster bacterium]|nr:hypothetical protein [SAR324 cluster bacterium]MBL7034540.1 hypothetical protein [SAR324 cluster bacterium]